MSIDPKILKRMQGEDTFLQSQNRGSRRVKLNRGQNWIVRFLPARLGPEEMFFARIARHWLNKLPIACPRNTAPDFGGDPEADCPVCTMADELNASADEIISKAGYNAKATPQFLTYCIVWEKDGVAQPMSEILNPYEFWHYRSTWEELKGFYIAGGRKSENSILDYATGNDFSVNKTAKGMRLDKQDSSPIFDLKEPKYAEWIKKIESQLKSPKVTIPTFEQLQVFAAKVEEAAHRGGGGGGEDDAPRRRRPAPVDEDADLRRPRRGAPAHEEGEDDLPYDSPSPAARAAAPASARRSAPEPVDDGGDDQPAARRRPAPEDDAPAPRRAAPRAEEDEVAPRRPAPRASAPAEEPEEDPAPPPRRAAPARAAAPVEEEAEEPAPAPRRPAPVARRATAPAAAEAEDPEPDSPEPEPEPEAGDAPAPRRAAPVATTGSRRLEPTARRAAAPEAAASAPQAEAEEEDQLPEDDRDPVPPAPKRTNPRALESDDDTPPPVVRKGGQGAAIADRLAKLPRGA